MGCRSVEDKDQFDEIGAKFDVEFNVACSYSLMPVNRLERVSAIEASAYQVFNSERLFKPSS